MERFIDYSFIQSLVTDNNLKSSMERFIVEECKDGFTRIYI